MRPFYIRLLNSLLMSFTHPDLKDRVMNDHDMLLEALLDDMEKRKAYSSYCIEVGRSIPRLFFDRIYWRYDMISNYIKIGYRNLKKQPMFSFINILGLAVGMTCFTLALLYSLHHFSFDNFHDDADQIHHIVQHQSTDNGTMQNDMRVPSPVFAELESGLPEIESSLRLIQLSTRLIHLDDQSFFEKRVFMADANILSFFSYKMLHGDPESALSRPHSVLITESLAKKYFGDEDPLGQRIRVDEWQQPIRITGILEDLPANSNLQFDMLLSTVGYRWVNDKDVSSLCFVRLKPNTLLPDLNTKLTKHLHAKLPDFKEQSIRFSAFPLKNIHLKSLHIQSNYRPTMSMIFWFIILIGFVILIIVCINFMNLSTARFIGRMKEVGLRKVVGATRKQLAVQFFTEALISAHLAIPVAIILFSIVKPTFIAIIGEPLRMDLFSNIPMMFFLWGITVVVGLFSGSYPAIYLSRFKPIAIFTEMSPSGMKGQRIRKALVIIQFTFTLILVMSTFLLHHQLSFLKKLDLGYESDQVAVIPIHHSIVDKCEVLEQKLLEHNKIISTGAANGLPFSWGHQATIYKSGMAADQGMLMKLYHVGYGFIDVLDMPLVTGTGFKRDQCQDDAIVISQSAARRFGWEDAIGKVLTIDNEQRTVVGVVEDFHFSHIFFERTPAIIILKPSWNHQLFVKYKGQLDQELLGFFKSQWIQMAPHLPFECENLSDLFQDNISSTMKVMDIFKGVSIVALFIASMGLIGLSSFSAQRRIKEIGIRKVLGASEISVVALLIKDFLKLVLVANIIGVPIAYALMRKFSQLAWVEDAPFSVTTLIITVFLSFITAILSTGWQALRAALAQPVHSIRIE
ncbi:ABC transporter permease [bacterium]|nr:ABC transporter permease [bacterium]